MQISADFSHVACDWRPLGTIYMQLAATRVQFIVACKAASFASTLREQLFELKNEDAIKKSENLRDTCAC
jgi:hypothetical protein